MLNDYGNTLLLEYLEKPEGYVTQE